MILVGDALEQLKTLADGSAQCCVTSPPYWGLRDYGVAGQLGLEKTPEEFVGKMGEVFREVRRVLKDDGTLWLNLGDSYAANSKNRTPDQAVKKTALGGGVLTQSQSLKQQSKIVSGLKQKDLVGIPWRVAFALQADGWYLRQDIIWHKPNPMPESVTDRCTKAHEYIFLLSKKPKYYFDIEAIKEIAITGHNGSSFNSDSDIATKRGVGTKPRQSQAKGSFKGKTGGKAFRHIAEMKQKRDVWTVSTQPFPQAHFATFPPNLIEPCILAGCPKGGTILDPFFGAGTTGLVAKKHGREYIGIELNPEYAAMAKERIEKSEFQMGLEA